MGLWTWNDGFRCLPAQADRSQFPFMGLWTWNDLTAEDLMKEAPSQFPFMGLWTWNVRTAELVVSWARISIPIYGIMNLKHFMPTDVPSGRYNLNSHLWDYEPETPHGAEAHRGAHASQFPFMGLWTWNPVNIGQFEQKLSDLNSHLWDYEPETPLR